MSWSFGRVLMLFFDKYFLVNIIWHQKFARTLETVMRINFNINFFYLQIIFFCLSLQGFYDYQSKDFSNFLPYNLYLYRNQILMTGYIFPRKIIGSLIGRCQKKFFMILHSPCTRKSQKVNDGNFVGKQKNLVKNYFFKWQFWTFDWKLSDEIFGKIQKFAFQVSPNSSPHVSAATNASDRPSIYKQHLKTKKLSSFKMLLNQQILNIG